MKNETIKTKDSIRLLILLVGLLLITIFINKEDNVLTGHAVFSKDISISTTSSLGFFIEFDKKQAQEYISSVKITGHKTRDSEITLELKNNKCVLAGKEIEGDFSEYCGNCCRLSTQENAGILLINVFGGRVDISKLSYEISDSPEEIQNMTIEQINESQANAPLEITENQTSENQTSEKDLIENKTKVEREEKEETEEKTVKAENIEETEIKEDIIVEKNERKEYKDAKIEAQSIIVEEGAELVLDDVTLTSEEIILKKGSTIIVRNSRNTIYQNSNLTISGANYILDNSILVMNASYDGHIGIIVEDGGNISIINNSLVTNGKDYDGNSSAHYFFMILGGSNPAGIEFKDSTIEYAGFYSGDNKKTGLYVAGRVIDIENVTIQEGYYGLILNSVNDTQLNNLTLYNINQTSIFLTDSNNITINELYVNNASNGVVVSGTNNLLANSSINVSETGVRMQDFNNTMLYNNIISNGISGEGVYLSGSNSILSYNNITANITGVFIFGSNNTILNNTILTTKENALTKTIDINLNVNGVKIYNNTLLGNNYAIYLGKNLSNIEIENNAIRDFNTSFLNVPVIFFDGSAINILIHNNKLINVYNGIGNYIGSSDNYDNITITNNIFLNFSGDIGALYFVDYGYGYASNILIKDNYFENVYFGPWIETKNLFNITFENNTVKNTKYTGIGITGYNHSENIVFRKNTIINDTSNEGALSLWTKAENVIIEENNISKSKNCIYFYEQGNSGMNNINITNNYLKDCAQNSIFIYNGRNILVENNRINSILSGSMAFNITNSQEVIIKDNNVSLSTSSNGLNIENSSKINATNNSILQSSEIENSREITIQNSVFNDYIRFTNVSDSSFSDNVVNNLGTSNLLGFMNNNSNIEISRNNISSFYSVSVNSIHFFSNSRNRNISISKNIINGNNYEGSNAIEILTNSFLSDSIITENLINNVSSGIDLLNGSNVNISFNNITNFRNRGIAIVQQGNNYIHNNRIINQTNQSTTRPAVILGGIGYPYYKSDNNVFENNTIINAYIGGIITKGNNNIIRNNNIINTSNYAVYVYKGSDNITIENNTITESNATGIIIDKANNNNIILNLITGMRSLDTGIVLNNTRNNIITLNNISNNLGDGLKLINATANITHNIINNNSYSGIGNYNLSINETATNILNNTLCYNGLYGIWQENARSVQDGIELNDSNNFCAGSNNEGVIKQRWYIQVRVVDNSGNNISNANVNVYEPASNTTAKYNLITDSNGLTSSNITVEYEINNSGEYSNKTPHKIEASKGIMNNSVILNINESRLYSLGNEIIINIDPCSCFVEPDSCELHNKICIVYYNVTRNNDTIIDNTTIYVNASYDGEFGFNFANGILNITNNSIITNGKDIGGNSSAHYFFIAEENTLVEISNSNISYAGIYSGSDDDLYGVVIKSDNAIINNNTFAFGHHILDIRGDYGKIYNNRIYNSEISDELGILVSGNHTNIQNNTAYNNYIGIRLFSNSNNILFNNTAYNNTRYGIYLESSSNNNLTTNTIYTNSEGILLLLSSNNTVSNNLIYDNMNIGINISQASYNIIIENNISNNSIGIYAETADNNQIENNIIQKISSDGISLKDSNNNILESNNIFDSDRGIHLYNSTYNIIKDNNLYDNQYCVVLRSLSSYNAISNNTIYNNTEGIALDFGSSHNVLESNDIYNNTNIGMSIGINTENNSALLNNIYSNNYGLRIRNSNNSRIIKNKISENTYGISINGSSSDLSKDNIIENNTIIYNEYGISINDNFSVNNSIYFNYFINNTLQANDSSCSGCNHWNITSNTSVSPPPYPTGNYWSDIFSIPLNITDTNQDGWGDSGSQYPYSATNGANSDGYVIDYGPMLTRPYTPGGGGGGGGGPRCGNRICDSNENCSTCPRDCGECELCGDGLCTAPEDCFLCPHDCGKCSDCGNRVCDANENCSTCQQDCGICPPTIPPEKPPIVEKPEVPEIIIPEKVISSISEKTQLIGYAFAAAFLFLFLLSPYIIMPKSFIEPKALNILISTNNLKRIKKIRSITQPLNLKKLKVENLTLSEEAAALAIAQNYGLSIDVVKTLMIANKHYRPRVFVASKIPETLKKDFRHVKNYNYVEEDGKIIKEKKLSDKKKVKEQKEIIKKPIFQAPTKINKYLEEKPTQNKAEKKKHVSPKTDTSKIDNLIDALNKLEKR